MYIKAYACSIVGLQLSIQEFLGVKHFVGHSV